MDLNIICHRVHKVTSRCASICGFSILVTTLCMLNLTRVLFKPANKIEQLHLWWCANWLYCRCTCAVMRPCYIAGHTQWQIFRRGPCKRQPRTAHARRQQKRAVQHNFDGELGHGWLPVTLEDILNSDMSFFHLFPRRPLEATKSSSP